VASIKRKRGKTMHTEGGGNREETSDNPQTAKIVSSCGGTMVRGALCGTLVRGVLPVKRK